MNTKLVIRHTATFIVCMIGVGAVSMLGNGYAIVGGLLIGSYGHKHVLDFVTKKVVK